MHKRSKVTVILAVAAAFAHKAGLQVRIGDDRDRRDIYTRAHHFDYKADIKPSLSESRNFKNSASNQWPEARRRSHNTAQSPARKRPQAHIASMR